jgi:RelE-like toxin of type II toxin-antitoxin system HigB
LRNEKQPGYSKLNDLKSSAGNSLEALVRDLKGKHSIRINDQWRIVFRWKENGAEFIDENSGGPRVRLRKGPRAKPSKR